MHLNALLNSYFVTCEKPVYKTNLSAFSKAHAVTTYQQIVFVDARKDISGDEEERRRALVCIAFLHECAHLKRLIYRCKGDYL